MNAESERGEALVTTASTSVTGKTSNETGKGAMEEDTTANSAAAGDSAGTGSGGRAPGPGEAGESAKGAETPKGAETAKAGESAEAGGEPPLGSRAPHFIRRSRTLHISWQVGVFLVGLAVVGAGVAMLVLPGPGWVVIFAGMAIWATEFVWAQLVLRWTKRKVTEAAQRALDPRVRRRNLILTGLGVAICAVLAGVYLWKFGLVMPWKIEE
jgi:uncharacterized protein (TIGR02611 family)